MDTAWIPIFVLTLAECVAPPGKMVCQEREFELQFLTQSDCESTLQQLVSLKETSDTVIVDKSRSGCAPSARQQRVFTSLAEVTEAAGDKQAWRAPQIQPPATESTQDLHKSRLETLPTCEASKGVAPCKVGEIIIEDTADVKRGEVWRRD